MAKLTVADIFGDPGLQNSYTPQVKDHIISQGQGFGVDSIFNKYSLFRYSKFGANINTYNVGLHYQGRSAVPNGNPNASQQSQDLQNKVFGGGKMKEIGPDFQDVIDNPDAKTIIEYFRNFKDASEDALGPTPYAWTDFLWCKFYGKIPNNRLITLRRYPFPVNDNLKAAKNKVLVPLSQAVTWFGEETGNKLSQIIPNKLSINWKQIQVQEQTVEGNEITVKSLLHLLGKEGKEKVDAIMPVISTLYDLAGLNKDGNYSSGASQLQFTGYFEKMQDYFQKLYTTGPYWNQVFGPVSVIDRTMIRDRGLSVDSYAQPITLKFHYNLRSYAGVRAKVAFLDLLANFLELTYLNGSYLNILEKYLPTAGASLNDPSLNHVISLAMQSGNVDKVTEAMKLLTGSLLTIIHTSIENVGNDSKKDPTGTAGKVVNFLANNFLATYFGSSMRSIVEKSALNYRPIGEWHLVIGNPLNPIATIGDLICKDVQIELGDELGPDDFPTEVTFTVTLQMAKPRDLFGYESIFNLGNGAMYVNSLKAPSSQSNTYDAGNYKLNYKPVYSDSEASQAGGATKAESGQGVDIGEIKTRIQNAYGKGYSTDLIDSYFGSNKEIVSQKTDPNIVENRIETNSQEQ